MLDHEFIPAADPNSKCLMVMLHGLGDSIEGYRWLPQVMALPWLNYLLVNAPDEYYGGFSWYDFAHDPVPGVARSRKALFELLDALREKGYRAEDITLGGFSQGCLMSVETGLRYPHRLAGIVGISGYVLDLEKLLAELSPIARQQRLLVTHGTLDPIVPFARTQAQVKQLQAAGIPLEWHEYRKEHTIAGEPELQVIRKFIAAGYPNTPIR
jgi:phospholipase/carboxylesterase